MNAIISIHPGAIITNLRDQAFAQMAKGQGVSWEEARDRDWGKMIFGIPKKSNHQDAKNAKRVKYFRIRTDDSKKIQALRQDIMMIPYSVTLFDFRQLSKNQTMALKAFIHRVLQRYTSENPRPAYSWIFLEIKILWRPQGDAFSIIVAQMIYI